MAFSGKRLSSRCLADSSTTAASASGVIVTIWYCSYLGRTYARISRSEEHTSELQSPCNLVCRLLLEKKKTSNQFVLADHRDVRGAHDAGRRRESSVHDIVARQLFFTPFNSQHRIQDVAFNFARFNLR